MKISIIIPCYNHGQYIQETIKSIENIVKTYESEVIIINDGSTDLKTIEILNKIKEDGYTVIHQNNKGLGSARNNGIRIAKGKYILPLDSDNLVLSPYINQAIDILEKNEDISIVYGDAEFFGEKSGKWKVGSFNLQKLMLGNYIDACAVYRKSVWEFLGGYDEKMPKMGTEDWDFWLNCSFNNFNFQYLEVPCFGYRVLKNSMIHSFSVLDFKQIYEYLEDKYSTKLSFKSINLSFGNQLDNNLELIVKHVSLLNIIYCIWLKTAKIVKHILPKYQFLK